MESTPPRDSGDAHASLTAADRARERLAAGLRLPRRHHAVLAASIAIQIGTAAYGISEQTTAGMGILLAGLGLLLAAAAFTVHRFRRLNGVRVDALSSRVVLGTGTVSSLVYLGSLAAATWAAFEATWWLVAVAAVVGGVGHAVGARQWWLDYRDDPAAHASGPPPLLLAVLAVIGCVGLAALVVLG